MRKIEALKEAHTKLANCKDIHDVVDIIADASGLSRSTVLDMLFYGTEY